MPAHPAILIDYKGMATELLRLWGKTYGSDGSRVETAVLAVSTLLTGENLLLAQTSPGGEAGTSIQE